ncbi:MAG: transposase [Chitinophagales bacterium]
MSDKYQNKYRIASTRLQYWDYRWASTYFVTICTHNHEHYFGDIENDKMQLSHIGILADVLWHEIKNHTKNVELGAYVIMPNHVHGILMIEGNNNLDKQNNDNVTNKTGHALSLPTKQTIGQQRFQNIGKNSLSSIIGSYKSAVTKHARRLGFEFHWQRLFHEHIIREDVKFDKITNYITNNPSSWTKDKFYSKKK